MTARALTRLVVSVTPVVYISSIGMVMSLPK